MNFNIRGENLEVTPALRGYVEKKVSKLERYFDTTPVADVHVNMEVQNSEKILEVTIPMPQLLLRAEETHTDMYAAIDLATDKLERQIRKYKTKVNRKFRQNGKTSEVFKANIEELNEEIANGGVKEAPLTDEVTEEDDSLEIVRTKRFNLKPMDTEEAILQMDMLGHNFFVFANSVSGDTSVVYKRRDGRYGLIEPEE
ncbi:ribosome hibernation-promoting factor, HPF/YfiA family [Marinococcus sp. PL1-022]|jgi:putative sigma-54 modulation protein|uniref:ribosome hibernation-promoting factor, HPF/YfiA family n=1 Tax=Marinococcus sp. PL1-022 TaxID=3095363 RepID=UPI0026138584|nr:ribosome-associated translation inhibitor RaiA [Marinococcus sp. PL1-022]MDX6151740.1 ribosome-associated translation inhibitor RaiA [Marinococcus sp. PL1-022]